MTFKDKFFSGISKKSANRKVVHKMVINKHGTTNDFLKIGPFLALQRNLPIGKWSTKRSLTNYACMTSIEKKNAFKKGSMYTLN